MDSETTVGKVTGPPHSKMQWTIEDFFGLENDKYYYSPSFDFAGAKWRIPMYFDRSYIYFYFSRKGTVGTGHSVHFTIGLQRQDGTASRFKVNGTVELKGRCENWEKFFERENYLDIQKLKAYKEDLAPQGRLTVFCDLTENEMSGIEVASSTDPLVQITHQEENDGLQLSSPPVADITNLQRDFKMLLYRGDRSDVIINVKGEELRAHMAILAARSPVFASMFQYQMAEKSGDIVNIDDCEADIFKEFLQYVYCESMDNLSIEIVSSLYKLAYEYQVDGLKKVCVAFTKSNLTVHTVCDIFEMGRRYNEDEVMKVVTDFFSRNMKAVIQCEEWKAFIREWPMEANDLLIMAL